MNIHLQFDRSTLEGATALHFAIHSRDFGVFHSLVSAGADIEARLPCLQNQTPLHLAVEFLEVDMVKMLVEAGSEVNSTFDVKCKYSPFQSLRTAHRVNDDARAKVSALHQVRLWF